MDRYQPFHDLASAQREAPESAMRRIQHAQVSQLYGVTAEHVGDLTHRMSEYPEVPSYANGYDYVYPKVERTLRWLRNPYGFRKEVEEQAKTNFEYYKGRGELPKWYTSPEAGLSHLRKLGLEYANEHMKLPVFNEAQTIARDAAVAVGKFMFSDAEENLSELKKILDKGPEMWALVAGDLG